MSDLRDHSQPCPICGWLMPMLIDGFPVQRVACSECRGAGGRVVAIDLDEAARFLNQFLSFQSISDAKTEAHELAGIVVDTALGKYDE